MTNSAESCIVCHGPGQLEPTATNHALAFASGAQDNVVLTNVSVVADAGGHMAISFHAANSAGAAVTSVVAGDLRVYVAGLIPGTASGLSSDYFDRWVQERTGTFDPDGTAGPKPAQNYPFGTFTAVGGGDYTYTTAALVSGAPAASTIQRIFFSVSKSATATVPGMNAGNAIYDFDKANVAVAVANPRDIVPTTACNQCHIERIADHGHGGSRNVEPACVVCHSPLLDESAFTDTPHDMQALGYDFPTMVHQIHSGINHTALPGGGGSDWSGIVFPAKINDCQKCHSGGTASNNYKNNPSRMACGGCHTNVDFVTGANHPGDAQADDSGCKYCHTATKIDGYHSVAPAGMNVPEFDVTLSITDPANGTFYVAGERPTVTVTLKKHSDGSAVDPAVYTTAKDVAGHAGGGLSAANLYVYGPRTAPKPVLTAGALKTPVPTQATQLFTGSTDPNVQTDATGFKYQLNAIPAGMTGTYFVRFYTTDYGRISDTDYVTDSNAFTKIQIGTATEQKKIAGDTCMNCHGTGTAPWHDTRHNVVVDTDQCVSCHDLSGNHADPLANRVHAVHSSSATGDAAHISWTEIEYPVGASRTLPRSGGDGGIMRCSVCHNSGNTQFQSNVAEISCMGCHADKPGALDHMRQMGGDY